MADTSGFVTDPKRAPYDWVSIYEQAQSGAFGDTSQSVLDHLTKDDSYANGIYNSLVEKGVVKPNDLTTEEYSNENGQGTRPHYGDDSVDWSKLPKIAGGKEAPTGYYWTNIAHDDAPGIDNTLDRIVYRYNDPNYGLLGLVREKEPTMTDMVGNVMRSMAIGMFLGPVAGMIGGAAGFGAAGTGLIKAGLSTAVGSAISGKAPNPFNLLFTALKPSTMSGVKDIFNTGSAALDGAGNPFANLSMPSMDFSTMFPATSGIDFASYL